MSTEATQDTPVATMGDFFSKYGAEGALDGIDDTKNAVSEPPPEKEEPETDSSSETDDLDAATLQALGLTPEGSPEPSEDDATEGTAPPAIDLGSLAKTLGVETGELILDDGELKVRTKVDGDESLTSLKKLREGYQLREHFTRQNEAFLQQKQEWEQAQQAQAQQFTQAAEMAYEVLQGEEKALQSQYTRDWSQLRQDDPAEYAAQVAEYNQKLGQIRQRQQSLSQNFQQRQQQQMQQQQQHLETLRVEGRKQLADSLGWRDEKAFEQGGKRLREYLTSKVGLTAQEVDTTYDHRLLAVSEKARKYDELMGKVDLARKKVSVSHKVPSGSTSKPAGSKQRKAQESIKRLRTEQTVEAAADVFQNLGIV